MKVLALELSTALGSVAVVQDGAEIFGRAFANDRHNSAEFFAAVSAARETFPELGQIVVGLGPGSYAGTRIAISTAIGLQLATRASLLGVPSICGLDVGEREYCVVGDARRNSFWVGYVSDGVAVEMPKVVSEPELRARVDHAGDAIYSAETLTAFPEVARAHPSAARLARLASPDHPNVMLPPLQPLYLREPHITVSKQPVWKRAS